MKKKDIIINNFLGGIAWGFGTVVGATIVATIIIGMLKSLGVFNGLINFVNELNTVTQQINPPIL